MARFHLQRRIVAEPKVNKRDCVELFKQHISTVKRNTAYLQVFTLFSPTLLVSTEETKQQQNIAISLQSVKAKVDVIRIILDKKQFQYENQQFTKNT